VLSRTHEEISPSAWQWAFFLNVFWGRHKFWENLAKFLSFCSVNPNNSSNSGKKITILSTSQNLKKKKKTLLLVSGFFEEKNLEFKKKMRIRLIRLFIGKKIAKISISRYCWKKTKKKNRAARSGGTLVVNMVVKKKWSKQ
jgi:hypothetical protein